MSEEVVEVPKDALAAALQENNDHTIDVLGKKFRLASKLTVAATYGISKSQRDEDLAGLIDATAKMVHPDDRDAFVEFLLSDHEDGQEIDMEDFGEIFKDALEKVTGRPLEQ